MTPDRLNECLQHGREFKRFECKCCQTIFMREYQRRRRQTKPNVALAERAKERAAKQGLAYSLRAEDLAIPERCAVFGIPLVKGEARSGQSPSLDRLRPELGYVRENVRVISDRANQLKSDHNLEDLKRRAAAGPEHLREQYRQLALYVERECLLEEVRRKANAGGKAGAEWRRLQLFLEERFARNLARRVDFGEN